MDLEKRRQMIRMLETIERFPEFSKKMGLENVSTFHGKSVVDQTKTPPLST